MSPTCPEYVEGKGSLSKGVGSSILMVTMTINMDDSRLVRIGQLEDFLKVGASVSFAGKSRDETYRWIEVILSKFWYFSLRKKEKTTVKKYLMKMTGYSDAQLTRLIKSQTRSLRNITNFTSVPI